jgi:hypothetical protein
MADVILVKKKPEPVENESPAFFMDEEKQELVSLKILRVSRIVLADKHYGKFGVDSEVSMVSHLIRMAARINTTPSELVRAMIMTNKEFRLEMAEYWTQKAGVK